ncbi:MAG: alpha/beta hydrolase [Gemmatimonadaceae bacterium]|jgi:hypothetical protein|nr:alpha/beta hydrolase [Gemmatimonadaceae bacterium]
MPIRLPRALRASTISTLSAVVAMSLSADVLDAQRAPRIVPVTFSSGGETLVGRLLLPADAPAGTRLPGVVVTGAWMTVKEQMATTYATQLAQRGMAALVFDFRGWGESGGAVRQRENPSQKIEDIMAAAAFLATRPEIDPARVGGLGICASAGYMVTAATRSSAIRSVALVAPWLQDGAIVEAVYGGKAGVDGLMAAGRAAETAYAASGTQTFVPAASLTDKRAIMFGVPYYTEADRGMIPAWRNEADPAFWPAWLTFDAMPAASLTKPFFMVHSDAAAIPQGAKQFYAALAAPKSQQWLDGVSQLDFYDRPAPVTQASDAVARHFTSTLR